MFQVTKIKYLQTKRSYSFSAILIALLMGYLSYHVSIYNAQYGLLLSVIIAFFINQHHNYRKDKNFVATLFTQNKFTYSIQYFIFCIPFLVGFIVSRQYYPIIIIAFSIIMIPFIQAKINPPKLTWLINKLKPSTSNFELISTIRSNVIALFVLTLLVLILTPVKFFFLIPLFFINSIFCAGYNYCEPRIMLNASSENPRRFLLKKTLQVSKLMFAVNSLPIMVNSFIHYDVAWNGLTFLIGNLLYANYCVYKKYAKYEANKTISQSLDDIFMILAIFIPFFLPIAFYISYSTKQKAIKYLETC